MHVSHPAMGQASSSHESVGQQIHDISSKVSEAMVSGDAFGQLWYAHDLQATYSARLDTAKQCLSALGDASQGHGKAISLNDAAFSEADRQSAQEGMRLQQGLE